MLIKNEESAWQKASASLDATAKIYGFRVDSVHSETFKFLGGLNRNKKELNLNHGNDGDAQEGDNETKKKEKVRRGVNTLETNINKLNLSKYDIDLEVDPLFSVMTSKFNESSARGLLLNTIPLDENLNYILESKKEENEFSYKNFTKLNEKDNKKDEIKTNDSETLSNELSELSGSQKAKDDLLLINNLKKNKNEDNTPISCSQDFDHTKEGIKKILKSFIKDNIIDDFIKLQICPDLTIFRESRKINTGETNMSFINIFKEEINLADKKLLNNDYDDNNSIIDEEDQDNLVIAEGDEALEEIQEGTSQNSNNEIVHEENNENIQNFENEFQNQNNITNFNPKTNESFNVFRYEDLIERAGHFGSGNTQNLPQFSNFAKNFGNLDKNYYLNKGSIFGLNFKKEGKVKKKKEEKNFIFSEKFEVDINDLFSDIKSKMLNKAYDYTKDYEKRRKAKCYIHFDKLSQFKLFTITGKTILAKDIDNDLDIAQQEKNLEEDNQENEMNDSGENENQNDIIGFERNNDYDAFYQNEKKAEKNFGRLYRKFDIRSLKKKLWTSYEDIKMDQKIDFKNVITNMSKDMNEDELFSISTPTCFVCLLHLCNEKNLFIKQKNMEMFFIEKDPDGSKSNKSSETKKQNNDDDYEEISRNLDFDD